MFEHLQGGFSSVSLQAVITTLSMLCLESPTQSLNLALALGLCKQCNIRVVADCRVKEQ